MCESPCHSSARRGRLTSEKGSAMSTMKDADQGPRGQAPDTPDARRRVKVLKITTPDDWLLARAIEDGLRPVR